MSKSIKMRAGQTMFLVETDDSVEIPAQFQAQVCEHLPEGMKPVVDFSRIEREFSEVKDLIVACCNGLFDAIAKIPNPEKVAIEFGIKLAGEAGIPMLTKASGEANFKVSVEWKKV